MLNPSYRFLMIFAVLLCISFCAVHAKSKYHPGLTTYYPTKIEWIQLELEANYRTDSLAESSGYSLDSVATGPETITIVVVYLPSVDMRIVNFVLDSEKKRAIEVAMRYGVVLDVKPDVQMASLPND